MNSPQQSGQRYTWIGYAAGIVCMTALFIAGLATGKPQLAVMAGTLAALLGTIWASAAAARKAAVQRTTRAEPVAATATTPVRPSPQAAHDLLQEASRLESASRAGAGWPHITMLLGLGAITSLSMLSFWFVARYDESLVALPMIAMLVWLGIFMAFMFAFGRSTKRGFGRRWMTFMMIWAGLWVVGIVLSSTLFAGELWFTLLIATAITVNSVTGAWLEARK
ncbi:hypothetical protein [Arthrobacter sp. JSM 101049]|uniref:hypothetical protein n=1 Tax=Arthrobacter sp. JSM 101049 TaxID=929097 RepID=UPI003565929C